MIQVVIFDFWGVIYNPNTGELHEGLAEFMQELTRRNLRCGIASSSSQEEILRVLHGTSFAKQFEIIIGAYDVQFLKPHPECYQKVADFFQISPQHSLVIDDSASAVQAAKLAGFKTRLFGDDVNDFQAISLDEVS